MELRQAQPLILSMEKIQMGEINYVFTIGTMHAENGTVDGFYLEMWARCIHSKKIVFHDSHFHTDVKYLTDLQLTAIEKERAEPGFMANKWINAFDRIAEEMNSRNKSKSKKKVFSLRFNDDLQRKFTEKCKQNGQSQSQVVRMLMESYISGAES